MYHIQNRIFHQHIDQTRTYTISEPEDPLSKIKINMVNMLLLVSELTHLRLSGGDWALSFIINV